MNNKEIQKLNDKVKHVKKLYEIKKLKIKLDAAYKNNLKRNLNRNPNSSKITFNREKQMKESIIKLNTDEKLFGCLNLPECKNVIKKLSNNKEYRHIVLSTASKEYISKLKSLVFLNNNNKNLFQLNINEELLKNLKPKNIPNKKPNMFVKTLINDYKKNELAYKQNVEKLRNANKFTWRHIAQQISRSLVIGTFITSYLCKNSVFDEKWNSVKTKLISIYTRQTGTTKYNYSLAKVHGKVNGKVYGKVPVQNNKVNATFQKLNTSTISNILDNLFEIENINNMYASFKRKKGNLRNTNEHGTNQNNLSNDLLDKELNLYLKLKQQLKDNLTALENLIQDVPEYSWVTKRTNWGGKTQHITGRYYNHYHLKHFKNLFKYNYNSTIQHKRTILPMLFLSLGFGLGVGSCMDNTIMTYVGMANDPRVTKEDFLNSEIKRNSTHFECQVRSEQCKKSNFYTCMKTNGKPLEDVFDIITLGNFYRHLKPMDNTNTKNDITIYAYNTYKLPLLYEFLYSLKSFNKLQYAFRTPLKE